MSRFTDSFMKREPTLEQVNQYIIDNSPSSLVVKTTLVSVQGDTATIRLRVRGASMWHYTDELTIRVGNSIDFHDHSDEDCSLVTSVPFCFDKDWGIND